MYDWSKDATTIGFRCVQSIHKCMYSVAARFLNSHISRPKPKTKNFCQMANGVLLKIVVSDWFITRYLHVNNTRSRFNYQFYDMGKEFRLAL